MKKLLLWLVIVMVSVIGVLDMSGHRLNYMDAITEEDAFVDDSDEMTILVEQDVSYGKIVLFNNERSGYFSIAIVKKTGFLWQAKIRKNIGPERDKVINVISNYENNKAKENQFVIGLEVNDPNMKYILYGSELEDDYGSYIMTDHLMAPVVNGYCLFVLDDYNSSYWNFYALDDKKKIIATRVAGSGKVKYLQE